MRALTFEQACRRYPNRYTMTHVPAWAAMPSKVNGFFYAPQFRDCREWYENTAFPGDVGTFAGDGAYSSGQTWPVGKWLPVRFTNEALAVAARAKCAETHRDEARDLRDTVRQLCSEMRIDTLSSMSHSILCDKLRELRARHSECMRTVGVMS